MFCHVIVDRRGGEKLNSHGFRFTPQRRHVYNLLLQKRDHPTANEVFLRARQALPEISMATVYNCLDALVQSGLIRQVNLDRAATRYCPNMEEHGHFHCDDCGGLYDVNYVSAVAQSAVQLPSGFLPARYEMAIRGICADCAARVERPSRRALRKEPAAANA